MRDFLPFVVIGVTSGSIYAIAALGLVLTYKTSGIFNFAHGTVAAGSAYLFHELREVRGLPWPLAAVLVVGGLAPLFGLGMERLARRLAEVGTAGKVVATVGLLVGIQGLITAVYGSAARSFPPFLPTTPYRFFGVNVSADQIITMAVAAVAAAGLFAFFRFSRLGTAMRSVVDDPALLSLTGTNPARVRGVAWMIGSAFAALSGILIAPTIGLDVLILTLLVVQAFGAAAVGAFQSLPLTYLGGLIVGVGADVSKKYVADFPALSGFPASVPFIVLFVVLLLLPRRKLVESGGEVRPRLDDRTGVADPRLRRAAVVALGAAAMAVPVVVGSRLPVFTSGVITALLFASLALLVRTSGQVSLCHGAFAAVGATTFAHLTTGLGLPWPLALALAGLLTVPVGALVAIPAIRLSGLFLALATLGFGVLLERLLYRTGLMFGGQGTRIVPRPAWASTDTGYYYIVLGVAALGIGLCVLVSGTRLGRLLRAMADSPTALSTSGTNVNVTRVLVFCLSAYLAGVAGALLAAQFQTVSTTGFNALLSLQILVVLYIAGTRQVAAPVIAALLYSVLPSYSSAGLVELQPVVFGAGAVAVALLSARPGGFNGIVRAAAAASDHRHRRSPVASRSLPAAPAIEAVP